MKRRSPPSLSAASFAFAAALAALCACDQRGGERAESSRGVRIVATPSSIATLSAAHVTNGLPAAVCLGGPLGRSALFLKFPSEWRVRGIPVRAFVALSKREDAPEGGPPVTLEVWRVSSAWQAKQLHEWSDKPNLLPPYSRAELSSSSGSDLRIDVTELVGFATENPERDFGIALLASGGPGHGVTFATGSGGDRAPRLELYYRR